MAKTLAQAVSEIKEKEDPNKRMKIGMFGDAKSIAGKILSGIGLGAAATGCGQPQDITGGIILDQVPDLRQHTDIDDIAEKHGPRKDIPVQETEEQQNNRFLQEIVQQAREAGKLKNAKGRIPERIYYSDRANGNVDAGAVSVGGGMIPGVADFIVPGLTDKGAIFINPKHMKNLPPETRQFVIAHETGHQLFGEDDRYGVEDSTTRRGAEPPFEYDGGDQMFGEYPFPTDDESGMAKGQRRQVDEIIKKNIKGIYKRFLERQK